MLFPIYAKTLVDNLYDHARLAVQAFLVIGGFLAAKSLSPALLPVAGPGPLVLVWRRYRRLAPPYLAALGLAIVASALARSLAANPTVPAAPSLFQIEAHILMLQGVLQLEALSAGIWYVAIDLQLYALLALLFWLLKPLAAREQSLAPWLMPMACALLALASLFWFNRQPDLDEWAVYVCAAGGLGALAHWISCRPRRWPWSLLLTLVVAAALLVEWRSRILVAAVTTLLLIWGVGRRPPEWLRSRIVSGLSRISYSVFLVHYPVCLVVGALVYHLWPESVPANAAGMAAAWGLSLMAGQLLFRQVELRFRPAYC